MDLNPHLGMKIRPGGYRSKPKPIDKEDLCTALKNLLDDICDLVGQLDDFNLWMASNLAK